MSWIGDHPLLEVGYWISQIVLTFIAMAAALFAYRQVTAYATFELLKFTLDEEARLARAKVIRELRTTNYLDWKNDPSAMHAAAKVCASYNVLARVLQAGLVTRKKFFIRPLAPGIVQTHEALLPYIQDRRTESGPVLWDNYTWMYEQARKILLKENALPTAPNQPDSP